MFLSPLAKLMVACGLQAATLLLAAMIICRLWRNGSAAQKHLVLATTFLATILLPFGKVFFPKVPMRVLPRETPRIFAESFAPAGPVFSPAPPSRSPDTARPEEPPENPAHPGGSRESRKPLLYYAGFLGVLISGLMAAGLVLSWLRIRLLEKSGQPVPLPASVMAGLQDLLRSKPPPGIVSHRKVRAPFISGWLNPRIFLPENYRSWPETCLLSVLRHETAHLIRQDFLIQQFINTGLVLYWFNPVAWLAAGLIRREREKACDDLALENGSKPSAYAECLLEVVKNLRGSIVPPTAVGIMHNSKLGERIKAVLSPTVNRVLPSRRLCKWCGGMAGVILLALTVLRLTPAVSAASKNPPMPIQNTLETLTVEVRDEAGRPVEGATIVPMGLRTAVDPGSSYGWHDTKGDRATPPQSKTNAQGAAAVPYPKYTAEDAETGAVTLRVTHPGYCKSRSDVSVSSPKPVVLQKGASVSVTAYPNGEEGTREAACVHLAAEGIMLDTVDWRAEGKGSRAQVPKGQYALRAITFDSAGAASFSPPVMIDTTENTRMNLDLGVSKGREISGELSANVPRPVREGRVIAYIVTPASDRKFDMEWRTCANIMTDGKFTLTGIPPGQVQLVAICAGFVSADPNGPRKGLSTLPQIFDPAPGEILRIAMEKCGTAQVKAVAPDGKPLPEALVAFWPNQVFGNSSSILGQTFDQGAFLQKQRQGLPWVLPRETRYQAKTDAAGIATIPNLPPGPMQFSVMAKGWEMPLETPAGIARRSSSVQIKPGETSAATVKMKPEGTTSLKDAMASSIAQSNAGACPGGASALSGTPIAVKPGKDFSGQVVDADGKPLQNVLVDAWTWCGGNEARTDAEGRFVLKEPGVDRKIEVQFSLPGHSPVHITQQPIGSLQEPVVLTDKTYFEGTVTDSRGAPLAGQLVRATCREKQGDGVLISTVWQETKTDQQGHYRLYVFPDTYEFQIRSAAGETARVSAQTIAADESSGLDLRLSPGLTFRAKLTDSQTGKPVAGVRLGNWQHKDIRGMSDEKGEITIKGMLPGDFEFGVDAEKQGYCRWWSSQAKNEWDRYKIEPSGWQRNFDSLEFLIGESSEPVEIVLEKGVTIRGMVKDPNGQPVAGATVAPANVSGNSLTGDTRFSFVSGQDGTFEMLLPASNGVQYNLIAHDGKYGEWRKWANGVLPPIKTQPGEILSGVEISLSKPCVIKGTVKDAAGNPAANRRVRATPLDLQENRYYYPETRTKADGTFELKYVRSGKHRVLAAWTDPQGMPQNASAEVELSPESQSQAVELAAEPRS